MHDNVLLGGPVWAFAAFLILLALALTGYVALDSLRPKRRASAAGRLREPLALYTAVAAAYVLLVVIVWSTRGVQVGAAVVTVATPFAIALGFAYLLRVVFPKPEGWGEPPYAHDGERADGVASADDGVDGGEHADRSEDYDRSGTDDSWFDDIDDEER